jgi:hypothetical protein
MVKQPVLVRDLLRAVQGLRGSYTSFPDAAAAQPRLNDLASGLRLAGADQACIPEGQRTLLHEVAELGLLYRCVIGREVHARVSVSMCCEQRATATAAAAAAWRFCLMPAAPPHTCMMLPLQACAGHDHAGAAWRLCGAGAGWRAARGRNRLPAPAGRAGGAAGGTTAAAGG